MLAKTHVFFAILLSILFVVSPCEGDRNIKNDVSTQKCQPQYQHQHQHQHQHQEDHPPPSSTTKGPRLIGLNVNGRVKSLLWNNPKTFMDSKLSPLFSSACEYEDEEVRYNHSNGSVTRIVKTVDNDRKETKQRGLASLFLPGAVYGTADYRFRKERWYGVEKVGIIFSWNMLCPWSHCNDKDDEDEDEDEKVRRTKAIFFGLPTTLDIAAYRSFPSPSKASHNKDFTSFIDSGNLRIGWQQKDAGDVAVGVDGVNPWIQIGFEAKDYVSNDDFLVVNSKERNTIPFHLRFFLPLIHRRFDVQWTSRWGTHTTERSSKNSEKREYDARSQWSSKYKQSNDDPWWIPQLSLDPSMGTLSSENRYRNSFLGGEDRRYRTEFKLRIRTTMPTLLSSVTNNAFSTSDDDDDDLETASLRLECSLLTDPGEMRCPTLGSSLTTARFETVVVPSFWLRSVTETARFGLIHEQNHVLNN